jgi:hypothetical protein
MTLLSRYYFKVLNDIHIDVVQINKINIFDLITIVLSSIKIKQKKNTEIIVKNCN